MSNLFDLREWLQKADKAGQLKTIKGARLEDEVGILTELNAKRRGPAFLFDEFAGYPKGFRILSGSMLNAATFGLTLGIEGKTDNMSMVFSTANILNTVSEKAKEFPVKYVNDGPVLENKMVGDDVDLETFPVPIWHEKDGGAYIGTGCVQIHKDPDTGWINLGTYRVQRADKDSLTNYIISSHHGYAIRAKYWAQGKPCPVAIVFGVHPLLFLMGGADVPLGADEYTWAGAIAGERVPVIEGKVTGLPIPADAEIVIEGLAYPDDNVMEGPFGEFTGYYAGGQTLQPRIKVKAIYYRNNPILLGSPASKPPHDYSYSASVMRSAGIKNALEKAGIPEVKGVWISEPGTSRHWVTTSIKQKFAGHATQAAVIAANCQQGSMMTKYSIVVDEDIDPSDSDQIIWAISTRSNPSEDIDILRQCLSNNIEPVLDNETKAAGKLYISRAIIRAVKPFHMIKNGSFPPVAIAASPDKMSQVKEKFADLF